MSKSVTVDTVVTIVGDGEVDTFRTSVGTPVVLADSPATRYMYPLGVGYNTINIVTSPSGTRPKIALMIPDPAVGPTNEKWIKGITGDTGKQWYGQIIMLEISASDTSINVTCTAAEHVEIFQL
jgi:hypothetical protein